MITGGIYGALLFSGAAMAIIPVKAKTVPGFLSTLIGYVAIGFVVGSVIGLAMTAPVGERCPEGQVHVSPARNSAGVSGCVPVDVLPEIAK